LLKNLLKEDGEKLFVLLTALRSAGRRRKLARIQGFVGEETVRFILATQLQLFWDNWKVSHPLLIPPRAGNCP